MRMCFTKDEIALNVKETSDEIGDLYEKWCDNNLDAILKDWFKHDDYTVEDIESMSFIINVHIVAKFKKYLKGKNLIED